jgi:hypothetical protein
MPTIAYFYGIAIQMFYDDHNPPHLHARYGRAKAVIRLTARLSPANCRRWRRVSSGTGRWRDGPN